MKLEEINQRIREIENDTMSDLAERTALTEELLKEYRGEDRVIPFAEFKPGGKKGRFDSGVDQLDEITGGLGRGDVITITGDTGDGKTTFARFMTEKLSGTGQKCLWFSYEESNEEFLSKFNILPDGYLPQVLNDTSLTWIEARILEAILKYKVGVVFIDNLYFITDYTTRNNTTTEIAITMRRLKTIAMKYDITIFLLAHIKKQDSGIIDKNSIRDSKAVADISSLIIALWRVKQDQEKEDVEKNGQLWTNDTVFSVIKNRYNGQYKSFKMTFQDNYFTSVLPSKKEIQHEVNAAELF